MASNSRRPGRLGIVLAVLLALGIQLGAFWMISVLSANLIQENARQTDAVAAKSSALRGQLKKLTDGFLAANSAVSEFLLTGNEIALNPFRKANDESPRTIAAIAKLSEG